MTATLCADAPNLLRQCTRTADHPLPHRDGLGTWIHWHEHSPDEQITMTARLNDPDTIARLGLGGAR